MSVRNTSRALGDQAIVLEERDGPERRRRVDGTHPTWVTPHRAPDSSCSRARTLRPGDLTLELGEATATKRGFEQLVNALDKLGSTRVGRGTERGLDLVQRLQLTEQLDVRQAAATGEHLTD